MRRCATGRSSRKSLHAPPSRSGTTMVKATSPFNSFTSERTCSSMPPRVARRCSTCSTRSRPGRRSRSAAAVTRSITRRNGFERPHAATPGEYIGQRRSSTAALRARGPRRLPRSSRTRPRRRGARTRRRSRRSRSRDRARASRGRTPRRSRARTRDRTCPQAESTRCETSMQKPTAVGMRGYERSDTARTHSPIASTSIRSSSIA